MVNENAIHKVTPGTIDARREERPHVGGWTYRPASDIFATEDAHTIVLDLPGADSETIDITIEQGLLSIDAPVAPRPRPGRYTVQEYGVGGFHRRFRLDETIDVDGITADYRNGVLTLHLPRAPQARPRRIAVGG